MPFNPAHRNASQVHLNEHLLCATLPATISLYDVRLKGDTLEFGDLEGDVAGSCNEVPAVVAAEIALALLTALVPSCLSQLFRLSLQ